MDDDNHPFVVTCKVKPDFNAIITAYLLNEENIKWYERKTRLLAICDNAFAAGEVSRASEIRDERAMLDDGSWWASE